MNTVQIFTAIKNKDYLNIHDYLVTNHGVEYQYYIVKSMRMSSNPKVVIAYREFADASVHSIHGSKFIFHNVLKHMYHDTFKLQWFHPVKDGLLGLQDYIDLLDTIFI